MNAPANTLTMRQQHQAYCEKLLAGIDQTALSPDEQWHLRRRLGIGGSEIGTILGLNKYQTPFDLWLVKTGRKTPDDLSDKPAIHWGHKLEAVVADEYAERTGQVVTVDDTHYQAEVAPWMVGNVDRMVGEHKVLECKTASGFAAKKAGFGPGNVYDERGNLITACDEVPESYLLQCQHYMLVTGRQESDLAVLIDGRDYRIYTIPRNEDLIAAMVEAATNFWFDCVIADLPPEGAAQLEAVEQDATEEVVEADSEVMSLIRERKELSEAITELESQKKEVEGQIQSFMGSAQVLSRNGATMATWKPVTTNRFDSTAFKKADPATYAAYTKPSTSRTFRVN